MRDVIPPAVKFVRKQRELNNEDEEDSKLVQYTSKAEGVAIKEGSYLYFNPIHQTKVYLTKKEISLLADKLVSWALNDPEALKITLFFNDRGMTWDVVSDIRKRHPGFDAAYKIALQAIGDRREIGAVKRELSEGMVKYTLPLYDQSIREMELEKALLRIRAEEEAGKDARTKYIVLPPIESCPIVKELPKDTDEKEEV